MNELYHHGILGMKWGVRRYQNADGTLTAEGKKRNRSGGFTVKELGGMKKDAGRTARKKAWKESRENGNNIFKSASNARKAGVEAQRKVLASRNLGLIREGNSHVKKAAGATAAKVAVSAVGALTITELLKRGMTDKATTVRAIAKCGNALLTATTIRELVVGGVSYTGAVGQAGVRAVASARKKKKNS